MPTAVATRGNSSIRPVAETLDQATVLPGQQLMHYVVDEGTPALHGARLILLHQPHRLDDVDDEDRSHDACDLIYSGQNFGDHVLFPRLDLSHSAPLG